MTKLFRRIISITLSFVICFGFAIHALAVDPYAEHGLCITYIAEKEVGYPDPPSTNTTKYGTWFGSQSTWCAIFVSWCANQAGIPESVINKTASPYDSRQHFIQLDQYELSPYYGGDVEPQVGDLYYYTDDNWIASRIPTHVGIIIAVDSNYIYTIDGNWGGQVKLRTPPVSKNDPYFIGFARPGYTADHYIEFGYDSTKHFEKCSTIACQYTPFEETHYLDSNKYSHWCDSCGYNSDHNYTWAQYTHSLHRGTCACGVTTTASHSFITSGTTMTCSVCGYIVELAKSISN